MINRLIEPTTGTIEIDGEDVTAPDPVQLRRGIGYVIQQIGLFPHQKIVTNVMTVPLLYGESKATARQRADELLDLVGLDPATYGDRYPHQLSGGQRQRVGVARALAADPPVLLMDEPFGAVDPVVRVRLQDEFRRLQRDLGKTVVLVTHDIDEAVRMGDRVAIFQVGGGSRSTAPPPSCSPTRPTTSSPTSSAPPRACAGSPSPPSTRTTSSRSTAAPPATSPRPSTSAPPSRRPSRSCCATTRPSSASPTAPSSSAC